MPLCLCFCLCARCGSTVIVLGFRRMWIITCVNAVSRDRTARLVSTIFVLYSSLSLYTLLLIVACVSAQNEKSSHAYLFILFIYFIELDTHT